MAAMNLTRLRTHMNLRRLSIVVAVFLAALLAGLFSRDLTDQRSSSAESHSSRESLIAVPPQRDPGLSAELTTMIAGLRKLESGEDFANAWLQLARTGGKDWVRRRLLLLRWVKNDPEGAYRFLLEQQVAEDMSFLLETWTTLDPDTAIGVFHRDKRLLILFDATHIEKTIYQAALAHGPEKVIDLMAKHDADPGFINRNFAFEQAFRLLAEKHPNAALTRARNLTLGQKNVALGAIGAALARSDLDGAIAWAKSLPYDERDLALHGALGHLAQEDPEAIVPYLDQLNQPFIMGLRRIEGAGSVALRELTKRDPLKALAWIADNVSPEDGQSQAVQSIYLQEVMRFHPESVAAAIANVDDENVRQAAIHGLEDYSTWKDMRSALHGALDLPESTLRDEIVGRLAGAWADEDPGQALDYLNGIEDHYAGDLGLALERIVSNYVLRQPESEVGWGLLETVVETERHDLARNSILRLVGKGNLALAVERFDAYPWPAELYTDAVHNIAVDWAGDEPAAALDWVQSLSANADLKTTFQSIFSRWENLASASAYLRRLPATHERNRAIEGFVQAANRQENTVAALAWATEITDTPSRHAAQFEAVKGIDSEQALAVMGSLPMPEQDRAVLLEKIGGSRR